MVTLQDLPDELLLKIASHLAPDARNKLDLYILTHVSKQLARIARDILCRDVSLDVSATNTLLNTLLRYPDLAVKVQSLIISEEPIKLYDERQRPAQRLPGRLIEPRRQLHSLEHPGKPLPEALQPRPEAFNKAKFVAERYPFRMLLEKLNNLTTLTITDGEGSQCRALVEEIATFSTFPFRPRPFGRPLPPTLERLRIENVGWKIMDYLSVLKGEDYRAVMLSLKRVEIVWTKLYYVCGRARIENQLRTTLEGTGIELRCENSTYHGDSQMEASVVSSLNRRFAKVIKALERTDK